MKKYIIANWKMYFSYQQAVTWLKNYIHHLPLPQEFELVIAPSFEVLAIASSILKNNSISLGAQDCSAFELGAHTGQVSAQSLKELDCMYTMVGHYETRQELHQANEMIRHKLLLLQKYGIQPILCIGNHDDALDTLFSQLQVLQGLSSQLFPIIAYEPITSIGTGKTPPINQLTHIIKSIKDHAKLYIDGSVAVIYGGSINAQNASQYLQIPILDGLLIGKASTDFQELEKIVCLTKSLKL